MKVKINELEEEMNNKNPDLRIKNLKDENDRLHQLVIKHQETRNANKVSVSCQTKDELKVSN